MGTVLKIRTLHLMGTTVSLGLLEIGNFYTDVCPYYVLPDGLAPVGRHYLFIGLRFKGRQVKYYSTWKNALCIGI